MPDKEIDAFKLPTWEERGGEYVRRLMRDAGLTPEQAAGLVGNFGYESAGFTKLQEIKPQVAGSRGGWGIAQWTARRRRNFDQRVAENALFPASDEANYGFLLHELTGEYKRFASRLRQMRSIEDACRLTHKEYETPADVLDGSYRSGPDRLKWARRALEGAREAAVTAKGRPAIDRMMDIQRILLEGGEYRNRRTEEPGDIDGKYGEDSEAAIKELAAKAWAEIRTRQSAG